MSSTVTVNQRVVKVSGGGGGGGEMTRLKITVHEEQ